MSVHCCRTSRYAIKQGHPDCIQALFDNGFNITGAFDIAYSDTDETEKLIVDYEADLYIKEPAEP